MSGHRRPPIDRSGRGHVTKFWNFGIPSISREWLELEMSNLHLACRCITRVSNERNAKLGQMGSGRGHVTYFWNFGTPSISRKRLELETSNLASRFITSGTIERNAKLGQRGLKGSRDLLLKFWNPSICREWLELETSNLACSFITRRINEKNKIMLKGSRRGHVTYFWNFGTPFGWHLVDRC